MATLHKGRNESFVIIFLVKGGLDILQYLINNISQLRVATMVMAILDSLPYSPWWLLPNTTKNSAKE